MDLWSVIHSYLINPTWSLITMCESCHFDRSLNVEIAVEYQMIFVVVFINCSCEIHFGVPSRFRKGCVISFQNFHSNSFFFQHSRKLKCKQIFKIQHQFQHFNDLSKWHDKTILWFLGETFANIIKHHIKKQDRSITCSI